MEQQNSISRSRYLFAAYFDLVIMLNIFSLVRLFIGYMSKAISDSGVTLFLSLILYGMLFLFYIGKDAMFDGKTLGKRIAGLKLVTTSGGVFDLGKSVLRNIFSGFAFLFSLLYLGSYNEFMFYIIIFSCILINFILACCLKNRKLGDFLAKSQVVDDTENKWYQGISSHEKSLYSLTALLLLFELLYTYGHNVLINLILRLSHIYYEYSYLILEIVFSSVFYIILCFVVKNTVPFPLLRKLLYVASALSFFLALSKYIH